MKPVDDTFAVRLIRAQHKLGLSNVVVAELCDIYVTDIADYRTCKKQPKMENLRKLAKGLSISADYLLGLKDEMR